METGWPMSLVVQIHPARIGSKVNSTETTKLFSQIKFVVRGAMKSVGKHGGDPKRMVISCAMEKWRICRKQNYLSARKSVEEPVAGAQNSK